MSPYLLNAYMDVVVKHVKMRMGRKGESWHCLGSYMQTIRFCVVSWRNAGKSKVMTFNEEEGLEC